MRPKDDVQPAAPRSSQYFSIIGPTTGPVFRWDTWPTLGVVNTLESLRTIGTAYATGWVQHRTAPLKTYRLVVYKTELPGLWVCIERRFVRAEEAAERL
jgi:hypothetical protein